MVRLEPIVVKRERTPARLAALGVAWVLALGGLGMGFAKAAVAPAWIPLLVWLLFAVFVAVLHLDLFLGRQTLTFDGLRVTVRRTIGPVHLGTHAFVPSAMGRVCFEERRVRGKAGTYWTTELVTNYGGGRRALLKNLSGAQLQRLRTSETVKQLLRLV